MTNSPPDARDRISFTLNRFLAYVDSFLSSNAFIILFLFIYVNAVLLMFFWGARDQYRHAADHPMLWYITIARAFGYTLNLNTALVLLLASRITISIIRDTWLNLLLPFDKFFPAFHIVVALFIAFAVLFHAIFHFIWIIRWNMWGPGPFEINMTVATGIILAFVFFTMVFTSLPAIRRTRFSIFYGIHIAGAIFFYTLLLLHGVYNGEPYTYKWITAPIIIYLADRIIRKAKIRYSTITVSRDNSTLTNESILRLDLPKQFDYRPGQYAELKVPSINRTEWHPFTIASAPGEPIMTFYIKALGDWTKALREIIELRSKKEDAQPLEVWVRGPFGAPAQHVDGYQHVVLISGGIGATPFASVCKHVFFSIRNLKETTRFPCDTSSSTTESISSLEKEVMRSVGNVYDRGVDVSYFEGFSDCESVHSVHSSSALALDVQSCRSLRKVGDTGFDEEERKGSRRAAKPSRGMAKTGPNNSRGSGDLSSPSSFAVQTLNIDDAISASILKRHAQIPPNERVLRVLRSVAVNMALCLMLVIRVVIIAYVDLFYSSLRNGPIALPDGSSSRMVWLTGLDLILGCLMSVTIAVTVAVEVSVYGRTFFYSGGRIIDLSLLLPLTILSNVMALYVLSGQSGENMSVVLSVVHFATIMAGLFILLMYRLGRVMGSRVLLADRYRDTSFEKVRGVDFLWTTPTDEDDEWLREELGDLANGKELRLHRYVTRAKEDYLENGVRSDEVMTTNIGRPKWLEVFMRIAARSETGSKVGVFFCGPEGMAKAVQEAMGKVQTMTTMRGVYLGTNDAALRRQLGVGAPSELERLRQRGSNIRFILRKENFG